LKKTPALRVNERVLSSLQRRLRAVIDTVPANQRELVFGGLAPFEKRVQKPGKDELRSPAEVFVAAALVNRNRWTTVARRLQRFRKRFPKTRSFHQLLELVSPMNHKDVSEEVLGWAYSNRHNRPQLLKGLVKVFGAYRLQLERRMGRRVTDYELLRSWAREESPMTILDNVPGVGSKLVDWLMMFYGDVQTVPYDVWSDRGLKRLGFGSPGEYASFIARLFSIPPHTLDKVFRYSRQP